MNVLVQLLVTLAVLGAAVKLLLLNFWRAVLFISPGSARLLPESPDPDEPLPPALAPRAEELRALGFVPLGVHREKPRFQAGTRSHDFVHPGERAFATLYLTAAGQPHLYLLTPLAPEGYVLTADHKRPGFELAGRYRVEGVAGASPERLLRHHRERCQGLPGADDLSWERRLQVGRAWYQGAGQREIRRQNLQGLLWTLVALAIVLLLFIPRGK